MSTFSTRIKALACVACAVALGWAHVLAAAAEGNRIEALNVAGQQGGQVVVKIKFLDAQIVELNKQIEEIKKLREQTAQLLARKRVVEALQANRAEAVHLLDELVRQLPDGVYLKSVKQTDQRVAITGYAASNARVSTLMRNLESSPWLEGAALVEIKSAIVGTTQRLSEFQLNVGITRAKSEAPAKPKADAVKTGSSGTDTYERSSSAVVPATTVGG